MSEVIRLGAGGGGQEQRALVETIRASAEQPGTG